MTSDRQIAANHRNARRSTGPRSASGRRRSSRNSFRHGLAAGVTTSAKSTQYIERLARKIAGASPDFLTLEGARTFAQAEFELAQIRRVKLALISRVMAFGGLETPDDDLQSPGQIKRFLKELKRGELIPPDRIATAAMPTTDPERTAEAIRRALPELIKLDRYERRAAARRARAMNIFLDRKKRSNNLGLSY
jgi:hypothetical protein